MSEADSKQSPLNARERYVSRAVLICLAAFFIVIFWRVIVLREVMIGGDALYYSYPLRTHAWQIIKDGSLPLWTSSLLGGYPLFAMSQLAIAYPLTWGYLFLPGHWAEQIYLCAPFLFASVFTYLYSREIGRSHIASMLAALSFAYGGFFIPTVNGFLTNGAMWLPLLLLAIERAGTRKLAPYLLLTAGTFSMSILNGLGQAFLFVGVLAVVYAVFIGFWPTENSVRYMTQARLRPVLAAVGGIALATGLTAFQTLETWQAIGLSIRERLTYDTFIEGSFTAYSTWKSFLAPRFNMVDVMTYVPSLAAVLAVAAVLIATFAPRRLPRDPRVFFWLAVVVVSWILMLGGNTPVYRLVYHLPLFNLFRVPARHSFEWTFALSMLASYGWDATATALSREGGGTSADAKRTIAASLLLFLTGAAGASWFTTANTSPSEVHYIIAKLVFTLVLIATIWGTFRLASPRRRTLIAGSAVLIGCFVEASILFGHLWYPNSQSSKSAAFMRPSQATRFLQQFPAADGRVYTDGPDVSGLFDSFNMVPGYGLQNVAGYEPAMLSRYSRALGNVGPDTSQVRPGLTSDGNLFEPRSHVLDILNTRYTTTFWDLGDALDQAQEKNGINFTATAAPVKLRPHETASFSEETTAAGDELAVVSALGYANGVGQGERVGTIRLETANGETIERALLAGVDTAEWAHERPDIRATIPHALPAIFDSSPGDDNNSFPAYRYLSLISLGKKQQIARVEIVNTSGVHLAIWKLTIYDSERRASTPVELLGRDRWEPIYNKNRVLVLKNNRARPRAWLVGEVQSVTADEALSAIRGQRDPTFDPERVALVESPATELPPLPGGPLRNSSAMVVAYEPNRLVVDAIAESPSLLVLSEINYPGWVALVDGNRTPIFQTDYLLRGVFLPSGKHQVEMRYTAPAARRGLWLSGLSAIMLAGIFLVARRRSVSTD